MALDDVHVLNRSVFGDDGFHDDLATHSGEAGEQGIGRLRSGKNVGRHDSGGDGDWFAGEG